MIESITGRMAIVFSRLRSKKYRWITGPLVVFIITRGLIFIAGYIARVAFMDRIGPVPWQSHPDNIFLDMWDRWDAPYYRGIAANGYVYDPENLSGSTPFFPMYPLLIRAASLVFPDLTVAGMLVSNLCFLGALIFFYRLADLEFNHHPTAMRALYYIALFPAAFFFLTIYTESAFLLFSIACFYFARRRMWFWSGVAGAFATATRFIGIFLYAAVMLEWLNAHGWTIGQFFKRDSWSALLNSRKDWLGLLAVQLVLLGVAGYMLFLYLRFGDALAFQKALADWGKGTLVNPLATIWRDFSGILNQSFRSGDPTFLQVSLDTLAAVFAIAATPFIWWRIGESFAVYTLASVLLMAGTNSTQSMLRYVSVLFPIFMLLALWGRNTTVDKLITISFAILLAVLASIFVNWGFVA